LPKESIKYEIDPFNRLVLTKNCPITNLPKFRQALSGKFKLDKNNELIYTVKKPLSKNTPHQVNLKGSWSLNEDNNLALSLNKYKRDTLGDKLILKGKLIKPTKDSLGFSITTKTKNNKHTTYTLKLNGKWKADKHNQLNFNIKKNKDKKDALVLKGGWQLNNKAQITYIYEKREPSKRKKDTNALTFKGHWDIKGKKRISYCFDKKGASYFDFKASFSQFKSNYIKYKVEVISSKRKRPKNNTIKLFGQWRIKRGLGLTFDVKNKAGRPYSIGFGAKARLNKKNNIELKLKDIKNKDLGISLELNHKIIKGEGQAFLRFLEDKKGNSVVIGAGFGF
jgi:hypothetical protein